MSKRAALYARVSTDEQAEHGYSLPQQIADCRCYAEAHDFVVAAEFADDVSGTMPIGARPEGRRLEALIDAGAVDAVICYHTNRLYRDNLELQITTRRWLRAGLELHFCESGQVRSENDILLLIGGWYAQQDHADTVKRLRRGRYGKAKAGKVMLHGDRPPYGYRVSDDDQLVVYEPEAAIVRDVFTWYTDGDETGTRLAMRAIAQRLTQMRVPTWEDLHHLGRKSRPYGGWAPATIGRMLHNQTYKGLWHYGKVGPASSRANPRAEWIAVQVPAIVSPERWDAAQRAARRNRRAPNRNMKHQYLMRYRLVCSCGYRIGCRTKYRDLADGTRRCYTYYGCCGKQGEHVRSCNMPLFRADRVDALIWSWVHGWLLEPSLLLAEIETRQEQREGEHAALRERLSTAEDALSQNRAQLERLLDLYLAGDFERDILMQRRETLEQTSDEWEQKRAQLAAELQAATFSDAQRATLFELTHQVRARLGDPDLATFERRRALIEMLDVQGKLVVKDGEKVVYVRATLAELQDRLPLSDVTTIPRKPSLGRAGCA